MKNYSGMNHLYGNVLASIDLETTGGQPGYHEIIQIAVVPLDSDYEPHPGVRPFYMNIAPEFPERAEPDAMRANGLCLDDLIINAPSQSKVIDLLAEWFTALELPINKLLIPLSCNWAFESKFLTSWLGRAMTESMFHGHARDPMLAAIFLNDRAARCGETLPFPQVGLRALAERFKIENERAHDALHDSLTAARVYKALQTTEVF